MQKKKPALLAAVLNFLVVCLIVNTSFVFAASGILKEGMSGSEVTTLQQDLKTLGYLSVEPTGYYGSLTKEAVIKLQSKHGLEQDGIAGAKTFSVIKNLLYQSTATRSSGGSALKEGMSGDGVTSLQQDLKTLGYLSVEPTGYYGSLTKEAVIKLQSKHGLEQDGVAGAKTLSVIKNLLYQSTATRSSGGSALKEGMSGNSVTSLQQDLKALGYLSVEPTGYYGSLTKEAVIKLQSKHGLEQDGVAGAKTFSTIDRLMGRTSTTSTATRGNLSSKDYLLPWYGNAEKVFSIGSIAQVYDIRTGRTFNIKRTYGYNHADCETLTANDTKIMLEIYGGSWSWERRPIILTVNGRKIAASMAGMPHAGVDSAPANTYVKSRSGGYGGGDNLDAVKGNNMNGVFDVHFLNSKTHGTSRVDSNHQNALKEAANWAEKNGF